MRCKYCGSKMLFPDTKHKHFSTGKAVAGAVAFGLVGATAGFIGKDTEGYRCSACGAFNDTPMDAAEEVACNSAITEAKIRGQSIAYERCKEKYPNIENVLLRQEISNQPAQQYGETETLDIEKGPEKSIPLEASIKHSYEPNKYVVNCPVFVERVTIKKADDTDVLVMDVCNIGDKALRSVYFNVVVYDDVGDQIETVNCVYQGLSVAPGEYLPQTKEFNLKTEVAFKVTVECKKAAFTDDSVWRIEETPVVYELTDRDEITPSGFAQYKYLRVLLEEKSKLPSDRRIYCPVYEDGYHLCVCGNPVENGKTCTVCGLDETALLDIMDYDNLIQCRRELIVANAKARAETTEKLYAEAQGEKYDEACALMGKGTISSCEKAAELFLAIGGYKDAARKAKDCQAKAEDAKKESKYNSAMSLFVGNRVTQEQYEKAITILETIPGWKDADKKVAEFKGKIQEIKAAEEVDRKEKEKKAEEARLAAEKEEKARKKRNKIILVILLIVSVISVFLYLLFTVIIPNSKYNNALALMNEEKYDEAVVLFAELANYKDSSAQIDACEAAIIQNKYDAAMDYMENGDYQQAKLLFEELEDYKDSKKQVTEASYQYALTLWDAKDYEASNKLFEELGNYKESKEKIHKHDYNIEILTAAGCETEGEQKKSCKNCAYSYTETIAATGHSYKETILKAATCTAKGEKESTCTVCKKSNKSEISMIDHKYVEEMTKQATCESSGTKTYTCSCGKTYTETIKATGHQYDSGKITTPATCDKDGVKTFSCSCGKSYTEAVKATGHSYSNATCTESAKCSKCNTIKQAALGHTDNGKKRCSRCNKNLTPIFQKTYDSDSFTSEFINYNPADGKYRVTVVVNSVDESLIGYSSTWVPSFEVSKDCLVSVVKDSYMKAGETYTETCSVYGVDFYIKIKCCSITLTIEPLD